MKNDDFVLKNGQSFCNSRYAIHPPEGAQPERARDRRLLVDERWAAFQSGKPELQAFRGKPWVSHHIPSELHRRLWLNRTDATVAMAFLFAILLPRLGSMVSWH